MAPVSVQVVTTTIFAGDVPTGTPSPTDSGRPALPIASIVGGLVGGVVLACLLVFGWVWWGRSIEKQQRKSGPQLRSAMKSGSGSVPRPPGTNPMATASQKSVTFAPSPKTSDEEDKGKRVGSDRVKPGGASASRTSLDRAGGTPRASVDRASPTLGPSRISVDRAIPTAGSSRTSVDRATPIAGPSRISVDRPTTPGASRTSVDRTGAGISRTSVDRATPTAGSARTSIDRATTPGASRTSLDRTGAGISHTSLEPGTSSPSALGAGASRTSLDYAPTTAGTSRTSLDQMTPTSTRTVTPTAAATETSRTVTVLPTPSDHGTTSGLSTSLENGGPTPPQRSPLRTHAPTRPSPLSHKDTDLTLNDAAPLSTTVSTSPKTGSTAALRPKPPSPQPTSPPPPPPPGAAPPVPQVMAPALPPRSPTRPRRLTRPPPAPRAPPSVSEYPQSSASEGAEMALRGGGRDSPKVSRMR